MTGNVDISPAQRAQLHGLILDAYHDSAALAMFLDFRLGQTLSSIVSESRGMREIVFAVLDDAAENGWLVQLVLEALEDRPNSAGLRRWAETALPEYVPTRRSGNPADDQGQVPDHMYLDMNELRRIVEESLSKDENATLGIADPTVEATFDYVQVRARTAILSVNLRANQQRVLLRVAQDRRPENANRYFHGEKSRTREVCGHPQMIKFLDAGFTGFGHPFDLQFIDREILDDWHPLPAEKVIEIGAKLADALYFAHDLGVALGEINRSHILLAADGDPILSLPRFPLVSLSDERAAREAQDVQSLCATLLSMLSESSHLNGTSAADGDGTSLESRAREILRSGAQAERRRRPSALLLRDQLNALKQDAPSVVIDLDVSAKISVPARNGHTEAELHVVTGDLFDEQAAIVIGFSDTFDTATSDRKVISSESLQGQLIDRLYGGSVTELDRDLDTALTGKLHKREQRGDKARGKLKRYNVGTVAVLERDGRKIFGVAVSRMGNNLIARSSYEFLQVSLDDLWATVRDQGSPVVAMPIMGSGLARINTTRDALLRQIIRSFRMELRKGPICRELRIIVHPSDLGAIDVVAALKSALS